MLRAIIRWALKNEIERLAVLQRQVADLELRIDAHRRHLDANTSEILDLQQAMREQQSRVTAQFTEPEWAFTFLRQGNCSVGQAPVEKEPTAMYGGRRSLTPSGGSD